MSKFHYGDPEVALNLADLLIKGARVWPAKPAIIYGARTTTFAELDTAVNRLANGLASLGLRPGDRLAIMLPNIPEFAIAYFAILKLGATVVPVNPIFREMEIEYILADSQAKALIAWQPSLPEACKALANSPNCCHCLLVNDPEAPAAKPNVAAATRSLPLPAVLESSAPDFTAWPTRETDTAVILYTSGTTGRSKGAELTHFNMYTNAVTVTEMFDIKSDDRFIATLPLFHSFGQTHVMNAAFARGAAIIPHPRFEGARVLESLQRDGATLFAGVPTMYVLLLNTVEAIGAIEAIQANESSNRLQHSLRLCFSGGAPMPVYVLREFERRFGVPIIEGYGLSETSPVACANRLDKVRKPGSIGLPLRDVAIRVVDNDDRELGPGQVGEIVIKGPNIMKGYLNNTTATDEAIVAGWFHSGDLAYCDEDGYFFIVDRKKDMILKSGYNVYPREVEEVLYHHPAVAEAAVVGVPDPVKGEEVKAFVVLKQGAQTDSAQKQGALMDSAENKSAAITAESLIAYCQGLMAPYKCPRYVEFVAALPKSATGKILRRELRDRSTE